MTHWKKLAKPDAEYLGEPDFEPITKTYIATIKGHEIRELTTAGNKKSNKGVLLFEEKDIKPLVLNVSNSKTLNLLYGKYAEKWVGKKIEIFYDTNVKLGRELIGGTRIKNTVPITETETIACVDCGQVIKEIEGKATALQVANLTQKLYKRALCSECAAKEKLKLNPLTEVQNAE